MFNIESLSTEIDDFDIFDNADVNFSKCITMNPELSNEIEKVNKKTLDNKSKYLLGCFQLNVIEALNEIAKRNMDLDDFIYDITGPVCEIFGQINNNLNIQDTKDLKNLVFILELSSIILKDACESGNIETMYETISQFYMRIKDSELLKTDSVDDTIYNNE